MDGVSVIVCCYNSTARISETLKHLSCQKIVEKIPWEIVIVDNASTDDTLQSISFAVSSLSFGCSVRVVHEMQQGLVHARRKGITESSYEYIIFCDDDNWLSENYVSGAYIILEQNPLCGIAGCKISPSFEIQKPKWFDSYQLYYSVGERSVDSGDITNSAGSVLGAGMITRKSIWQKVFQSNYKFLCTDRKGNTLSTGGDMEMCTIVRELKFKIYYSNEISLKHFIPKERLTISYLKRNAFGVGMFYSLMQPYFYLSQEKEAQKWVWVKDLAYNVFQLWKPFIQLIQFKKLAFMIEFNLAIGKVYGLVSLQNQYSKNIEYIQSYYANRN